MPSPALKEWVEAEMPKMESLSLGSLHGSCVLDSPMLCIWAGEGLVESQGGHLVFLLTTPRLLKVFDCPASSKFLLQTLASCGAYSLGDVPLPVM